MSYDGAQLTCRLCNAQLEVYGVGRWKSIRILTLSAGGILILAGVYFYLYMVDWFLTTAILAAGALVSGYQIVRGALRALAHGRLGIDMLMTAAAGGAFLTGHPFEGAAVLYLFSVAETLEVMASERVRHSIASLLSLTPSTAQVRVGDTLVEKHVHDVTVDDIVLVRPGAGIPVDGVVVKGCTYVNESAVTGEPMPVRKDVGDAVYSGTVNLDGYIEVRVSKRPEDYLVSRIVRLVGEAIKRKSSTERLVDRFAGYYTPAVALAAVLTALLPSIILGEDLGTWTYRGLILLVAACPCALTISTPITVFSALTKAAAKGILVKGGVFLERLADVKAVLFDKTGTLTRGETKVVGIISYGVGEEHVLRLAASLEMFSEHPVARTVVARASEIGVAPGVVERFEVLRGFGVRGVLDGSEVAIGSVEMFKDIPEEIEYECRRHQKLGRTIVVVGSDGRVVGLIILEDKIKDNAVEVIQDLRQMGVEPAMISGDSPTTTATYAERLGIGHYHGMLKPEDKVGEVDKMRRLYRYVAMVGDGVNDAAALASSDVGIAMGGIGSDAAIESSDIVLMRDDTSLITYLIKLSRRTVKIMKQNIAASIAVKLTIVALGLLGYGSLALTVGVGDMGLSLAVIVNAWRVRLG